MVDVQSSATAPYIRIGREYIMWDVYVVDERFTPREETPREARRRRGRERSKLTTRRRQRRKAPHWMRPTKGR
jgi:hypothetical protein